MIKVKVNPYHYPWIIITLFVIGFLLAVALGFSPGHEKRGGKGHGFSMPAIVQQIPLQEFYKL